MGSIKVYRDIELQRTIYYRRICYDYYETAFTFFKILYHYTAHNVMCYDRMLTVCYSYNLTDTLLITPHLYNERLESFGVGGMSYVSDLLRG